MCTGATIAIAGSAVLGAMSSNRAAGQQQAGIDAALDENRRQFDLMREDMMPFIVGSQGAYDEVLQFIGLPTSAAMIAENELEEMEGRDRTGFSAEQQSRLNELNQYFEDNPERPGGREYGEAGETDDRGGQRHDQLRRERDELLTMELDEQQYNDDIARLNQTIETGAALTPEEIQAKVESTPGYQHRFNEGQRAVTTTQAAAGRQHGGRAMKELTRYGQAHASAEFSDAFNRSMAAAGLGRGATDTAASVGAQHAATAGNLQVAGGNAAAAGTMGTNQAVQQGLGNFMTSTLR